MFGKQAGLWLAMFGIAAITPTVLNLAADRLGDTAAGRGFATLNRYNTRQNG